MIYFENIFWRILYFVHIFECIYSHPLTDVHSTTESSGRYMTPLLALARGHGPFLSIGLCLLLDTSLKAGKSIGVYMWLELIIPDLHLFCLEIPALDSVYV